MKLLVFQLFPTATNIVITLKDVITLRKVFREKHLLKMTDATE